jgi:hypothetical protein
MGSYNPGACSFTERRFPVRIRIGVPPDGFGQRYTETDHRARIL